jgi:hypothetical protein
MDKEQRLFPYRSGDWEMQGWGTASGETVHAVPSHVEGEERRSGKDRGRRKGR